MARKSKAFLARSRAARQGAITRAINKFRVDKAKAARAKKAARTRRANKKIVEKMYGQLLRLEKKERRITGAENVGEGDFWEIEVGMTYGPGAE